MPDKLDHIRCAQQNHDFCCLQRLCGSKYQDWGVVVLFYASMHYVDAVLAQDTSLPSSLQQPKDHKARRLAVAKSSSLARIATHYLELYDRSLDVRYKCLSFPRGWAKVIKANYYDPMETELRAQLGLP